MSFALGEALGRRRVSWFSFLCLMGLIVFIPQGWISAFTWEHDTRWFYLFLIAFFSSTLLVPVSIDLAFRFKVLDMPDPRKVHKAPTPRWGGLAVFGAVVFTLCRNWTWSRELVGLLSAGMLIYIMGAIDDVRGISATARLAGQLAATTILIYSGISITAVPNIPGERIWEILVTYIWMVGITNAINFLDGIDGLAAGMGTVCSLLFCSIAWPERQGQLAYASAALAGASLGFIPYNWHPAKVFLGDGGATFIGFMLAGLAVMGSWADNNPIVAVSTPLLILSIPIFDMTYTTLSRIRRGDVRTFKQWIEYTGKDHFHHRCMKLGLSAPESVGFILLVNLCLGLNALVNRYASSTFGSALLLTQTFLFFIIIVVLMLLGRELTGD